MSHCCEGKRHKSSHLTFPFHSTLFSLTVCLGKNCHRRGGEGRGWKKSCLALFGQVRKGMEEK